MTTKDIVNEKLNELEQSLLNQDHINTPIEFLTQLVSLSKYFQKTPMSPLIVLNVS